MPEDEHRSFYPEVRSSGSLRAALQNALNAAGSELRVSAPPEFFSTTYARVESGPRFSQVYLAAKERLFLPDFWSDGVELGTGATPDLELLALAVNGWVSGSLRSTREMISHFDWFTPNSSAEAFEAGTEVEWAWARLLENPHASAATRALIQMASQEQVLRRLFPYTSGECLCFSRCTGFPYTRDIPCLSPHGEIESSIASLLRDLPFDCSPARRGTASSL
jgi:hypothetical protein